MARGADPYNQQKPGPLVWSLYILLLVIGLVVALGEELFRFVSRLMPGGRERQARAAARRIREDLQGALVLANTLAPDIPEIAAKVTKHAQRCERGLERHVGKGGWAEDLDQDSSWDRAIDLLRSAKRIGCIDWKSDRDGLREELDPLLARHGIALDWRFADELEEARQWERLKNQNLLPRVGAEVAKLGLVLTHINEGSDNYLMAVCTPEQFAALDGLCDNDGARSVGRFG